MVHYWMHNNMITINGTKMGKSLGNFITLDEFFNGTHKLLAQAYTCLLYTSFLADETNFRYQLQCYYDGQPLSLSEQKPVIVLTSSPSALLLGMELYFFPHIESVRILPFTCLLYTSRCV